MLGIHAVFGIVAGFMKSEMNVPEAEANGAARASVVGLKRWQAG